MNTTATPATPEARDVLDRALKLSAPEREVIARRLMDSVAPPPGVYESEDALRAELLRRIEDIESGRVKPITPEEMFANVRKALDEARNT
ncbi:Putative addiction module component [Gemmata obscuriglobus]|nr:addiction module protein [Gemmata obscuriglobus]QEG25523.1 Putative addiction module component [Gemmata obscuriglobus]VTR98838.1 : Unstab_antitox [Gemmata obscuriglobus UQM 2246]